MKRAITLVALSILAFVPAFAGRGILPPPIYFENLEEVLAGFDNPYQFLNRDLPDEIGRVMNYLDVFVGWLSTGWITIYGEDAFVPTGISPIGFGTAWLACTIDNWDYWVTAYHCAVSYEERYEFTHFRIRGQSAHLIYANLEKNIAIFRTQHMPGVVSLYMWFGLVPDEPHILQTPSVGDVVFISGWSIAGEPVEWNNRWGDWRIALLRGTSFGYVISTLPDNLVYLKADWFAFFGAIPGFSGSPVIIYRPNGDDVLNFRDFYLAGILNIGAGHYLGMTLIPPDIFDRIKQLHEHLTNITLWEEDE